MIKTNVSLLPKEVIALVQHVELNKAGWWDKGVQRLVLASVWLSDHAPNLKEIQQMLEQDFSLPLSDRKLLESLSALEKEDVLIKLQDDTFRIPDSQRAVFDSEIADAERVSNQARDFFFGLVLRICKELHPPQVWGVFESTFLAPLIKEVGTNAYHLISGSPMVVDKNIVNSFLKEFPATIHGDLRKIVADFLDPRKEEVRQYISRMLHARFCVEASGLSETIIGKLNSSAGKQIQFRVFVDTNFLFSLLDLHDNPSNDAARELQELITQLKHNLKIQLFIIPRTIKEAKASISAAKHSLTDIPSGSNFTRAALNLGFSGMALKFFEERFRRDGILKASDWFDPYLDNFIAIAREKGVEIFNEDLSLYSTRQDVVDDLNDILVAQKKRPEKKRKSYEKIEHDMVLWHFANDKRPAYIESPIDARDYIITVDFSLIGFDEHKQRRSDSKVPLCLHPTSLIQLLQFWVPRTKEFEEAMLGSMRLPFLFQKFDIEAERTSLKILRGLARFEGREDISEQTITRVILNEGLRSRMTSERTVDEYEEVALIRDALIQELQSRVDTESCKSEDLKVALNTKEAALITLESETKTKNDELVRLNGLFIDEKTRAIQSNEKLEIMDRQINELKSRLNEKEEVRNKQLAILGYLGLLSIVIGGSWMAAFYIDSIAQNSIEIVGLTTTRVLIAVIVFLIGHLILELWARNMPQIGQLWPFKLLKQFRVWLWSVAVIGLVIGIIGNLFASQIQKQIDIPKPYNSSYKAINIPMSSIEAPQR
jgi:hypothetical protein